ncbi:YbjQ family protein [Aquimarina agarivorans]|uniref:YbjQ family protein n=1 Tax=Aquimarina agarivorans TaxID=980584 RepID=UPI000248F275|nr:YbjQ family protein [Aquimarina agarivorans]
MILSTTDYVPNKEIIQILGVARGSTVRARNVGRDIFATLKNIVGGEISEYTKLQAESREQAMQRMQQDAKRLGADAVINVRLTTCMVMQGCSEILAYGTAVKFNQYEVYRIYDTWHSRINLGQFRYPLNLFYFLSNKTTKSRGF